MIKFDVENSGKVTIGKYVSQDDYGKSELNYFKYFVNGKELRANGGRAPRNFRRNIGKFYSIQFSTKYPNSIQANFDNEVTDQNRILEAGFDSEDIKTEKD